MKNLSLKSYKSAFNLLYNSIVVLCDNYSRYSCSFEYAKLFKRYRVSIFPKDSDSLIVTDSFVESLQSVLSDSSLLTAFCFKVEDNKIVIVIDVFNL